MLILLIQAVGVSSVHINACSKQCQMPLFIFGFNRDKILHQAEARLCSFGLQSEMGSPGFSLDTKAKQMPVVPDALVCQNIPKRHCRMGLVYNLLPLELEGKRKGQTALRENQSRCKKRDQR